jgi:hypothetical protein
MGASLVKLTEHQIAEHLKTVSKIQQHSIDILLENEVDGALISSTPEPDLHELLSEIGIKSAFQRAALVAELKKINAGQFSVENISSDEKKDNKKKEDLDKAVGEKAVEKSSVAHSIADAKKVGTSDKAKSDGAAAKKESGGFFGGFKVNSPNCSLSSFITLFNLSC